MATRDIRLQTKRSVTPNQALPGTLNSGEAVVNLSDGILYYQGFSGGTPAFTASPLDANYFEVGSHLTNQYLEGKITGYQGTSSLAGKFLSGTTTGFVLSDISSIQGVDTNTFVTGSTWSPNILTIGRNDGLSNIDVTIDTFTNVEVQGYIHNTGGNVVIQDNLTLNGNLTITGTTNIVHNDLTSIQGGTVGEYYHVTQTIHDALSGSASPSSSNVFATMADIAAAGGDTLEVKVSANDTTAGYLEDKLSGSTNISITTLNDGGNEIIFIDTTHTLDTNDYVTGGTLVGNTLVLNRTNALSAVTVDLSQFVDDTNDGVVSAATMNGNILELSRTEGLIDVTVDLSQFNSVDTYVTGFTYDDANTITLSRNESQPNITVDISTMADISVGGVVATGLTISSLGSGRMVYTDGSGGLTSEAAFTYVEGSNTMVVGGLQVNNPTNPVTIGQGGLAVGSGGVGDLTIQGDLTVLGTTTTLSTSELYVEDSTIELNYNPTGSTIATSIGSGWLIQDGTGVGASDVTYQIGQLYLNGNISSNAEYLLANEPSALNRGWFTNLNDIVIRNTNNNSGAPDGKRVLAEGDLLDGGTY